MTRKRDDAGFTLLELVTVMLIVAVIAAIGLPSFKYVTNSNRMAMEVNALLCDMQFARSEAVKQGTPVTVCATADFTSCANSNQWHSGWIVFVDVNGNNTVDAGAGDTIIRVQPAFSTAFTSTDTFVADNAFTGAVFNRMGFAATGTTNDVTITLHSNPVNSSWTRCLAITSVGLMQTEKATVGNCT